jgi:membrane protease YdiL (CAAX protease family)
MHVMDRPAVGTRAPVMVFILLALAGPAAFVMVSNHLFGSAPSLFTSVAIQIAYCALAVVLIAAALRVEGASIASLGIRRPTWGTFALALLLLLVAQFILPLVTTPLVRQFSSAAVDEGVRRLALLPLWLRLVMAVTGGTIEETLYRGYATERLVALTGRRAVGGAIAAVGFGIAHIPAWGSAFALTVDLPFGILMTIVYLWRRDLIANILAHVASLIIALLTL